MNTNRLNQKSLFESAFEGMSFNTTQHNFAPKRRVTSGGIMNMSNVLALVVTRLQAPFESLADKLSNLPLNPSQYILATYAIMNAKIVVQMDQHGYMVDHSLLAHAHRIINAVKRNAVTVPKWLQEIYDILSPTKTADGRYVIPIIPEFHECDEYRSLSENYADSKSIKTKKAPNTTTAIDSVKLSSVHDTMAFELKHPDAGSVAAAFFAPADPVWSASNRTTLKSNFLSTLTTPATSVVDVKDIPDLSKIDVPCPIFPESEQSKADIIHAFLTKEGNTYKLKNSSDYKKGEITKIAAQHMAASTSNYQQYIGHIRALKLSSTTKGLRAFNKETSQYFDTHTWGSNHPKQYLGHDGNTTAYYFGNPDVIQLVFESIQNMPLLSEAMHLGDLQALNLETENGEDSFANLALQTIPMQVGSDATRTFRPLLESEISEATEGNTYLDATKEKKCALTPTTNSITKTLEFAKNKKYFKAEEMTNNCLLVSGTKMPAMDDNDKFTLLHYHPWEMPANKILATFLHNEGANQAAAKDWKAPNTWPSAVDLSSNLKDINLEHTNNTHYFGTGWREHQHIRKALNNVDITSRSKLQKALATTPFITALEFDFSDSGFDVWNAIINNLKRMRYGAPKSQDKSAKPVQPKNEMGKRAAKLAKEYTERDAEEAEAARVAAEEAEAKAKEDVKT